MPAHPVHLGGVRFEHTPHLGQCPLCVLPAQVALQEDGRTAVRHRAYALFRAYLRVLL